MAISRYVVRIVHLWLEFAEIAIARVRRRVTQGGHAVPPIPDDNLARCFRDTAALDRAMRITIARVIRRHRLLNQPLVAGRDGQVVELDPHTVPIPEGVTEEEMGPVFDYL